MPADPAKTAFSAVIAELSQRFDAPIFEPHITIFGTVHGASLQPEDWLELTRAAVAGIEPFTVRAVGIGHSDDRFKCVYVELDESRELREIHDRLRSRLPDEYVLKPHLSLIYKALPTPVRQQLCHELQALELPTRWLSDSVAVVAPGTSGWSRVEEWNELHRVSLPV